MFSSPYPRTAALVLSSLALVFVCGTTLFSNAMIHQNVRAGTKVATTSGVGTTAGAAQSVKLPRRIFCFGDSLTAGTSPPNHELFPYAKHLEEAINSRNSVDADVDVDVDIDIDIDIDKTVQVRWKGYPGWTAPALLSNGGLSDFLAKAKAAQQQQENNGSQEQQPQPAIDLVVVLAGTNDLAYATDGREIFESIKAIHELAFSQGLVHQTIALGIPPSGWQAKSESARSLASEVNAKLESWAATTGDATSTSTSMSTAVFVPFPIQEYNRQSDLWSPDGLHFSPKGYQTIGESLAPIVADILWKGE